MANQFTSAVHVFSVDDLTATFSGLTFLDTPGMLDTTAAIIEPRVDKDGTIMYGIDSEFGFDVTDFIGAEPKELDGDFAEGYAGNILDTDGNVIGMAVYNSKTDVFKSGAPLGTWSLGLGGATVKASTEHYVSMQALLSDQAFPGDPNAIAPLDDDLKLLDLRPTEIDGVFEVGAMHEKYVDELSQALQVAMDNTVNNQTYTDLDFDRDGVMDTYSTIGTQVVADIDGDGTTEIILVGGVDLDGDGEADIVDSFLNGYGGEADLTDLLEPNEASVTYDIAYGQDYSVTLKDDGKLLYRWGEAVKRPNDIRMEVDLDLPEDWTADLDGNGTPDSLEDGSLGYIVTKAELVINHDITNNPNDQVRPEDYENEAAIGRLPSHYIVTDPDDASNQLWVSPVDSYAGDGTFLPSYFKLDAAGQIDLTAGGTAVYDPEGTLVGYRNVAEDGVTPIGTVLRDLSLATLAESADLDFMTEDLDLGFTAEWYGTTDREPFEWSYDKFADNPYANVFESFRNPDDAEAAGYSEAELVSGPRWRLTPNKFGQDLPGLEVPLEPNSQPPFQRDNIKYDTGTPITTTLNLLDWEGPSPLANSAGWMAIDADRLDENGDGLIDEGWSKVNGTLGAGDALPTGLILSAVTPNGINMDAEFLDTAVYVKGDRQDSAQLQDMQLHIEYGKAVALGSVQMVNNVTTNAQSVTFGGGASYDNAVVFATPTTLKGYQPVTVAFTEVTSTGVTLQLEEPDFYDGAHQPEDVALVAFEEGLYTLADGSMLEVGTTVFEAGATNSFHTVSFEHDFEDAPVLLVQVQTDNDVEWETVRARNVTENSFQFAIQEQEDSDGFHNSEIVGWAALDASSADGIVDWSGIMGEAFNTGPAIPSSGDTFEFNPDMGTDPLIAASITSFNGADTAILRLADLTDDGTTATAEFIVQEEKSFDSEIGHQAEVVTGMVFAEEGLLVGIDATADIFAFA